MEYRDFGQTGFKTSLLGFGGYHLLEIPGKEAGKLLNRYLDAGGNYIETAWSYGDGESETKIGQAVAHRRDDFILVTKSEERTRAGFAAAIDLSLQNLRTDRVDCLLMHGVGTMAELNTILAEGGAMEAALEAKQAGKVRQVGISMHGWPGPLLAALHSEQFAAVMSTMNYYDRCNYPEIEDRLLPLAQAKGAAVILMKPLADGFLYKSAEAAFRYAFSLPVSVVVTGINSAAMLEQDLQLAEEFRPMSGAEKEALFQNAPELGNYVCRQCGKCSCPRGIDIPEVFACEGYFDRQMARGVVGDTAEYALMERLRFWFGNQGLARERYGKLAVQADRCDGCGACLSQCPYQIDIPYKMGLVDYKLTDKKIY